MRKLLKTSGEVVDLPEPVDLDQISKLIGADALDTVLLADRRHVMLVDDLGHEKELPVNIKATELYWQKCIPGTTHVIRGDAVVTLDEEFGDD